MFDSNIQLRVSEEITLRGRTLADAEEIFSLVNANRAYLRRWLPWLDANTLVDDTRTHIERCLAQQAQGTGLVLTIVLNGKIIGMLGYNEIDQSNRGGFIGYWLSESQTGRGIMTLSCRRLVEFGFDELNLNRQGISAAVENSASRAIPERLRFSLEGIERDAEWLYDHFVDHAFHGVTRKAWQNQNANRSIQMPDQLSHRFAELNDCPTLAKWNQQLIRDEGHSNQMNVDELESRMRRFLSGEYRAIIIYLNQIAVGYALYREDANEVYLRQLFVEAEHRRTGIGRQTVAILRNQIWPAGKRLTVEVLSSNRRGIAFWQAVGYQNYCVQMEIRP